MKKLFVFAMTAALLTIFNGCQKDEMVGQLADEQLQAAVKSDVYVENGYLAFKNMEAVDSVIQMLTKMTADEKLAWENQMGFISARSEFDALFEIYDILQSYEEFLAFKKQNNKSLRFNETDKDDCSIDYPFATKYFIPVLNREGIYKVGKSIIKYTRNNQFAVLDGDAKKLKNIDSYLNDKAVIVFPEPELKSGSIIDKEVTSIHAFPEDNPNGDSNPFHRKPGIDKRKLKNELYYERYIYLEVIDMGNNHYIDSYENGILVYLNQRGQKVSWGKWRDYETVYSISRIRSQVSGSSEAQDGGTHTSAEVKPSATFYLHKRAEYKNYIKPTEFLPFPDYVNFAADVTFRGFGFAPTDYYTIETPENYSYTGGYSYPTDGWGW